MSDSKLRALAGRKMAHSLRYLQDLYINEEPKGWDSVPGNMKDALIRGTHEVKDFSANCMPLERKAWNVMDAKSRDNLLTKRPIDAWVSDLIVKTAKVSVLGRQRLFLERDAFGDLLQLDPEKKADDFLTTNKDWTFAVENLESVHLIFRHASEFLQAGTPPSKKARKKSADALAMENIIPSSVDIFTISKLKSNLVHYGMFGGLDSQTFERFELPGTLDSLIMTERSISPIERESLNNIVDYTAKMIAGMPIVLKGKLEPETQAGFQCVFRKMVKEMCGTVLSNKRLCVTPVTNMEAVEFKCEIREQYWEDFSRKSNSQKKPTERKNICCTR